MILDLDGFGTGNGKDALSTTVGSILHRGALNVHLENLNPWLPTVQIAWTITGKSFSLNVCDRVRVLDPQA